MYAGGRDKRGSIVETTVCPRRLIDAAGDAEETFLWWRTSAPFDHYGQPSGPPEWPWKGGMLHQSSKLRAAVDLLRAEWGRWLSFSAAQVQTEKDGRRWPRSS